MDEFWGVEVKNGEFLKVSPGDGLVLHLSQASLGELDGSTGKENVYLFVNVGGKKLVLGTLITNKLPQYQFNLSFDQDFELSHNWKTGSVYFYGYKTNESKSKEDPPLDLENNGTIESKAKQEKPADAPTANVCYEKSDSGSDPVKIQLAHNDQNTKSESTFEDLMSDDDKDSQVATSKKRSLESPECATETPICEKKKKVNPEGTDDQKTVPTIGNGDNAAPPTVVPNREILKKYPCKICNKLFSGEVGVKAHTKAKHGDVNQS